MNSLKDARKAKVHWTEVARAVGELERAGVPSGVVETPIQYAERLSGYSANQLRRMQAGLVFVEELSAARPDLAQWLGATKFTHAELLATLWRQDKSTAITLLERKPMLRYEWLYRLVHEGETSASPIARGKDIGRQFQEQWLKLLKKQTGQFTPFGEGNYTVIRAPKKHHPHCKPALVLRADWPGVLTRWAGIDFISTDKWHEPVWRQMMLVAVEASFFDAYYVFVRRVEETPEDAASRAQDMAIELQLSNVRVVAMMDGAFPDVPYLPETLPAPNPDRRPNWRPPAGGRELVSHSDGLADLRR